MRIPKPDRLIQEVSEWWRYLSLRQAAGYGCAVAGIGLTIATALAKGPNQAVIAVLAVVAQGIGAFLFAGHGRAHPTHAKRALGRLLRLGERVKNAENDAQANFEANDQTSDERQTQMGILSTELSWIGEGIYSAAADWIAFNDPLNEMINEDQRKAMVEDAQEAKKAAEGEVHVANENQGEATQLSLNSGDETSDRA